MDISSSVTEILIAFISGIFGPIAIMYAKKRFESKKQDLLTEAFEFGAVVDQEIDDLLFGLEVDRVWISQFHNGGNFYPTGKSIQKFSIFYETVHDGIQKITPQFQNIPCSLFAKSFAEIMTNDELLVQNFSSDDKTYGLKNVADTTGCKSIVMIPLKTHNGKIFGCLGVERVRRMGFETEDLITVRETAAFISGLLFQHLKNS
jgi:hypothetical protein